MFTDDQIEKYIHGKGDELITSTRRRVTLNETWVRQFPEEGGVYAAWETGESKPVYVGESKCLRNRMRDLLDSRHHILRHYIGEENFAHIEGFEKADSKNKFPPHIEKAVQEWITEKISIAVLPVKLGRVEVEEHLIDIHPPKYNRMGKRKPKKPKK